MFPYSLTTSTVIVSTLFILTNGYAITRDNQTLELRSSKAPTLMRRDDDPTSFAWVHRLAAIGDSFTAGIGSGAQLGEVFHNHDDWQCSRYDQSYPYIINDVIGPSVDEFQFAACSGDRSVQIYKQVEDVSGNLDMVIMTAGGNDLCLAGMIKKCVMMPFDGEETCNAVIEKAQTNIDTILKPNLKQILKALDGKMAKDGIVVYNGYARFFNTENEACATDQKWYYLKWWPTNWFKTGLKLTVARRQKFNDLVVQINNAIKDVIKDVEDEVNYTIGFSNWDPWPIDGVKGQMCDPSSTGRYPDSKQPDLQFFKPDSYVPKSDHDELRKREELIARRILHGKPPVIVDGIDVSIYDSILWKSPDPRAEVLHKLDKRAPSPPDCPGDKDWIDPTLGIGLPDSFGKLFHPNEKGHNTIASFAMAKAIDLRARVLGVAGQTCTITEEFRCWQKEGRKNSYASADRLNENYKDFCNNYVKQPANTVGWKSEKTYHEGTPDEHTFVLQLGEETADFDKDACLESYDRIINSCDGNDPENPLNFKFGGRWRRGEYAYEINIKRTNRPWPIKKTYGKCEGWYKVFFSSYTIYGAGFSGYDYGQKTMIPNMKGCFGLGITAWEFDYFDQPDSDGYEWKSTFRTPIWVRARCFSNNKIVQGAGGWTDGCSGND